MMQLVIRILIVLLIVIFHTAQSHAVWVWTPETNKWINPKYSVKDTPGEQLEYALEFFGAEDYETGIKELKKLIKHYPKAREAPDAQYKIGEAHYKLGQPFTAFKEYQKVIDMYPFSDLSVKIVEQQFQIGMEALEGIDEEKGFFKTFTGEIVNVADVFRQVIKNAPYSNIAPEAQYRIGLYLMEKMEYQTSRNEFEKTMNDYPETEWAKLAKYQIAVVDAKRSTGAAYDQKVTEAAISEFKEILEENPDADLSEDAKRQIAKLREKEAENNYMIANFYEKQKNFKSAKIYYQIIVDEYQETKFAQKALTKIQDLAIKEK